jgi:hypothetical protein
MPTYSTPTVLGDTVEVGNGVNTFLHYENTNASVRTVTLKMDHITLETGAVYPDKTYTLAANTGELWIPLRKSYANDAQNGIGRAKVTIDVNTGVTVAVIQMG